MSNPLDPNPWARFMGNYYARYPTEKRARLFNQHYYFDPRPGYEQDSSKYK